MHLSRRRLLATSGTVTTLGIAGCLGGSDGSDIPEYDCDADPPAEPVSELPRPVIGDPDADVVVAAHEDYACPHCATWKNEEFPAIKDDYIDPGTIRYEHWDLPIPVEEPWSNAVANAGRGVQDRDGNEAFFEFSRVVYQHYRDYSWDVIGYAAEEAGSEPCAAIVDGEFETYDGVLQDDRQTAIDRGVDSTPTVFVDGESVPATAEDVTEAIENAL